MEYVVEFILECIMEGCFAICQNKKISRWIRWPIFVGLIMFFASIIVGIFWFSVYLFHQNWPMSLLLLAIGLFLLIGCVVMFIKIAHRNK